MSNYSASVWRNGMHELPINPDSWTAVYMFKEEVFDLIVIYDRRKMYIDWCTEKLGCANVEWKDLGVSFYTFRVCFKNPTDAIAFKLRFNL